MNPCYSKIVKSQDWFDFLAGETVLSFREANKRLQDLFSFIKMAVQQRVNLTLKAPITTAADDIYE